ncbi:MAG: BA14K family protein [Bradyrhizobium sp.]|nr:BA14K family protein [Bradyrhizobium sp.]
MAVQKSGARKLVTRVLAAAVLLSMYAFGVVATTGAMGVSSAYAQRGRGRGGGGRGRGRGGGGNVGLGIGLGIGAAVIGGAIAASAAEQQRRDAIGYCMQRFRSYDPQSMTYMGTDGYRHPCP